MRIGHGYDVHRFLPEDGVTSHVALVALRFPAGHPSRPTPMVTS